LFEPYGKTSDIEIPVKNNKRTGYAFIKFDSIEGAVSAYAALDKSYFQGRKLHILPAQRKPPPKIREEIKIDHDLY
jgi:multiple RNA-binding domain-containing protein 1